MGCEGLWRLAHCYGRRWQGVGRAIHSGCSTSIHPLCPRQRSQSGPTDISRLHHKCNISSNLAKTIQGLFFMCWMGEEGLVVGVYAPLTQGAWAYRPLFSGATFFTLCLGEVTCHWLMKNGLISISISCKCLAVLQILLHFVNTCYSFNL